MDELENAVDNANADNSGDEVSNDLGSQAQDQGTPLEPAVEGNTEYQPDFGYQIKGEQYTFDERLHPVVKDKETEDFLRDTFTKAHGLDSVKSRLEETESRYKDVESQFNSTKLENENFRSTLERLNGLKESDPMGFQRQWGLSDQWVLDRANSILHNHDNPQQAQLAEQAYQARQDQWQSQQSYAQESERSQAMERQLHDIKMNQAIGSNEISEFAKKYDAKMGEGSFRSQVDDFGSLQWHQTQRYIDPQVAVSEVYSKLNKMWSPESGTPTSLDAASPNPKTPIPNMGRGRSGTPTTKRFNTLADLRAHAQYLAAQS